jgi:alpha-glucosidase
MTDWNSIEISIKLDFLLYVNYETSLCEDGINASRYASDYLLSRKDMHRDETVKIKMADGGGFLLRLRKK